MRGQVLKLPNGTPLMVSYNTGILDIDYGLYVDLLTDTGLVARLAETGSITPVLGDYKYVDSFAPLINRVMELHKASNGKPVEVAFDTETIGLNEYKQPNALHPGARFVSFQFSCEPGKSDVFYFHSRQHEQATLEDFSFLEQLSWLLSTPMISLRGANLKFDLRWLWARARITCTNFKLDTTLVGSLLDENRKNGLDVHAKIYVPALGGYSDEFDRTVDKGRMDLVPKDRLLPYAGGDTDACLQVSEVMKRELLQDKKLTAFYVNILHPAARAFEVVERGGVYIDREAFKSLEHDLNTAALKVVHRCKQVVGGRLVAKHADDEKPGGMNITKASFIQDYLFTEMGLNLKPNVFTAKLKPDGSKNPSTAFDNLVQYADIPEAKEFIQCLKEYGSLAKSLNTYVTGFLKCLCDDGKFHPNYFFFVGDRDEDEGGTNTGRLSTKNPAFQTIPKHSVWAAAIRRCYICPPGYVMLERDYSQGELKVVACIAHEQNMIDAYRQGLDLHTVTSARFAGYSYEEMIAWSKMEDSNPELYERYSETRQLGKAGNFGLLYGMGVEGFMIYAQLNYGVTLSYKDAEAFRNSFFDSYPGLVDYHKEYKALAKKDGQVRSPLGRIRHLPLIRSNNNEARSLAERQAINSPVQGTLSDMLLWSFAEMMAAKKEWYDNGIVLPMGAVHDAFYDYVREDKIEEVAKYALESMEDLPFHKVGWNPQLKFTADMKVGPNMADMKKLKLAA